MGVVYRDESYRRFLQPAPAAVGQALDLHPEIASLDRMCDELQHHGHVVAVSHMRTVSKEDWLVNCNVPDLQREQRGSVHARRMAVRKLDTTSHSCRFWSSFFFSP